MSKLRVGIIFGGKSDEHEVSLMSAASVINAMDKSKYDILPIGITKQGKWLIYDGDIEQIPNGNWESIAEKNLEENPDKYSFSVIGTPPNLKDSIDVAFPVLHGPYGEDGTIQGLFEMADIPYIGSGVLGSALAMDKIYAKKIFDKFELPICKDTLVMRTEIRYDIQSVIKNIEKEFKYPVFVKPANLGSSVGISKAHNHDELKAALLEAAKFDRKILIEEFINCRELEVAVFGNDNPQASVVGEIIPSHEFYDYKAKYFDNGGSKLCIPAPISKEKSDEIRAIAVKAYKALDCCGFSRVDFFIDKDTEKIILNEINTIPGFTKYSMYPLLWEEAGVAYSQVIDKLIEFGLERYKEKL